MKKIAVIIICTFLSVSFSFGQTEKQFLKAGENAFASGEYYEAIAYFKDALKFDKKNENAHYKIALSYYELKDYENAIPYFEKVTKQEDFPLIKFYQGSNQKLIGAYDAAIQSYKNFIDHYPIPGFYREKANQEIASCYWAKDQKLDATIDIKQFDKPLNTGYSDFAANHINENLIQVSSLQSKTKDLKSTFQSKLYFYDLDGEKITPSASYKFPISTTDSLDYANGFYVKEKQDFYYTQCYTEHEMGTKTCDIYVRNLKDGKWGDPVSLNLNTKEYTETQPQVSVNKQGEVILYFVSNRKGGKGKLDIWMAKELSFGKFGDITNLPATINTIDNESTPYYDANEGILYFSSEWHYGFGGYDIFKSVIEHGNWTSPVNLGAPLNSSANDQYYALTQQNTALLASNRKGAMQLKGAACCYDIFEHKISPIETIDSNLLAIEKLQEENEPSSSEVAKAFMDMQNSIPVTVYFHNDEPNPKTSATKTSLSYEDCYASYQEVKPLYFEEFEEEASITDWFETVDQSYRDLNHFLTILSDVLPNKPVTLQLEGYCSPLALNDYNINLAKRRIVNLENYILKWNEGVLKSYFNQGELKFQNAPFGEEKANSGVSDDFDNVKQSIYNPNAAIERRVAIIAIE